MRYKLLGRHSGLRVSEVSLGTGNFGTGWGHGATRDVARAIFDGYVEAGGNFIDTADSYQFGESESMLSEFIAPNRDELIVATKFSGGATPKPTLAKSGNSRKNMMYSVEQSLRRLKTDRIDLLWVHHADNVTPTEEILRGLDDLTRTGKILHAGFSNFPAWRVSHGVTLSELRGWAPLAAIQVEYSLIERTADRELLPMADAFGLGAVLWSPLGGGMLTGKYRTSPAGRLTSLGKVVHAEKDARGTAILDEVIAVANELGVLPMHVAIAWVMEKGRRSGASTIPIIGPRSKEQLDANLGALQVVLTESQLSRLTQVSDLPPGVPHGVNRETFATVSGGIPEQIELPRTTVR